MINIDITDRVPPVMQALLSDQAMETVLSDVASSAHAKWITLAQNALGQSRATYLAGIQDVKSEPGLRTITLVGWLPNAIENGLDSYDMRTTLLGPNAKNRRQRAGGGWYAHVPFRHQTPGTVGALAAPMGRAHGPRGGMGRGLEGSYTKQGAAALGKRIGKAAKKLGTFRDPKTGKMRQQRLPAGMALKLGRWLSSGRSGGQFYQEHKTDIYAGMIHSRKPGHEQYVTFRTISSKSGDGWIHPGIEARHLAEQVGDFVERIAPRVIQNMTKQAFNETK